MQDLTHPSGLVDEDDVLSEQSDDGGSNASYAIFARSSARQQQAITARARSTALENKMLVGTYHKHLIGALAGDAAMHAQLVEAVDGAGAAAAVRMLETFILARGNVVEVRPGAVQHVR